MRDSTYVARHLPEPTSFLYVKIHPVPWHSRVQIVLLTKISAPTEWQAAQEQVPHQHLPHNQHLPLPPPPPLLHNHPPPLPPPTTHQRSARVALQERPSEAPQSSSPSSVASSSSSAGSRDPTPHSLTPTSRTPLTPRTRRQVIQIHI